MRFLEVLQLLGVDACIRNAEMLRIVRAPLMSDEDHSFDPMNANEEFQMLFNESRLP